MRLPLAPSVGIVHGLEILEGKIFLASSRCADCYALFVGTDHRHIKAAEEETARSAGERYAELQPRSYQKIKPGPVALGNSVI